VEKDVEQINAISPYVASPDDSFKERRATFARLYEALPSYGSAMFWARIEERAASSLPLEVLVKVLREAVGREDVRTQRRLFELIIARVQSANEQWVSLVLDRTHFLAGELSAVAADLYADLCEQLLRQLRDTSQSFWEESFLHSLSYARKHTYENFMRREGYWRKETPGKGFRVPRTLALSLERVDWQDKEGRYDVCDERAEEALRAVERVELMAALLTRLPTKFRALLWLIFWEGQTEKAAAELLGISERTVRNHLRVALGQLRQILEQEVVDGASA
jgi:RNA polymerase sigma factor (sigma-70 family)